MSIAWYVNRLARMSPTEVAHRLVEHGKRRVSGRRIFKWSSFEGRGRFHPLPGIAISRDMVAPDLAVAIRQAADQILSGEYAALGVAWPKRQPDDLFPSDLWRLDPVTGKLWPGADRYCFDIPYRHEREMGDIKYVWELNRLQFLQPLAMAYALFSDKAALDAVDEALASWAAANPPFRGLCWNSGIELALRAVSILFAVSLCGNDLSPSTRRLIEPILEAHLYWIDRYPSRFSSANNHLVAELMASYVLTLCLRDQPDKGSLERLRREMAHEARCQILADGVPAEQSPTYGAFTAEMLLLCAAIGRASGQPLDAVVDQRLERFAHFVAVLSDSDGRVPMIGDDDEGRIFTLCATLENTYPASVARAIIGYLGATTSVPKPLRPELRDALFPAPSYRADAETGTTTFEEGGYTIIRTRASGRKVLLALDHGPLGYLSIAAHGHADANALILSLDDIPIFIDPGTYLYHSGHEWRDWFRGTRAHNTVVVNGTDQSVITGPFNWGSRAKARLESLPTEKGGWLSASHDGYRQRFGVDHRRQIAMRPDGILLKDELIPTGGNQSAEIVFQLAAGLSAQAYENSCLVSRDGVDLIRLAFRQPGVVTIQTGAQTIDGGWISTRFGTKVPAPRIAWLGKIPPGGVETKITVLES